MHEAEFQRWLGDLRVLAAEFGQAASKSRVPFDGRWRFRGYWEVFVPTYQDYETGWRHARLGIASNGDLARCNSAGWDGVVFRELVVRREFVITHDSGWPLEGLADKETMRASFVSTLAGMIGKRTR